MASEARAQSSYRVTERLESGGMAEVFRGEATSVAGFKKQVAIKRVLPHLASNEKFIRMFLDEARLSARLSHANIVQVFDLGREDDTYFIAMEHVHGDDRLRGPFVASLPVAGKAGTLANRMKGTIAEGQVQAKTGSFTNANGTQIAADVTGTLVSFVKKDLTGIIEAVSDALIGPYGEVRGSARLPAEGTAVELIIEPLKGGK